MMPTTPVVKKIVALLLFLTGMIAYQSPVMAVIVFPSTGGNSATGSPSDGDHGICPPNNPPVTADASISADGSSYDTSATISKGDTIYLKASYTLDYRLAEIAEIDGYIWKCNDCKLTRVKGVEYIGYKEGQSETIKEKGGSFESGKVLTYKAGAPTDGDKYIKFTLSIETTCVTQTGTAYDSVRMYIEGSEIIEEEDEEDNDDGYR